MADGNPRLVKSADDVGHLAGTGGQTHAERAFGGGAEFSELAEHIRGGVGLSGIDIDEQGWATDFGLQFGRATFADDLSLVDD